MPPFIIRPASKKAKRARLAFSGPAGSGKSRSSLEVATYIALQEQANIVLVDAEAGSGDDYADMFTYNVMPFDPPYSPKRYIEALRTAEESGAGVIILDSISHEWDGTGGVLEMVNNASGANKWTRWKVPGEQHDAFINAILTCPVHIICTIRERSKHEQVEDEEGNKKVVKLGMQPIQRDGVDFEFDTVVKLAREGNIGTVDKARSDALNGKVFPKPGADFASIYYKWLVEGIPDLEAALKSIKSRWCWAAHARDLIGMPRAGKPASAADAQKLVTILGPLYAQLETVEFEGTRDLTEKGILAIQHYEPHKAEATIKASSKEEPA